MGLWKVAFLRTWLNKGQGSLRCNKKALYNWSASSIMSNYGMTSLKSWINNCSIVPFINKLSTKEDTSEFVKVWEYYTDKGLGN